MKRHHIRPTKLFHANRPHVSVLLIAKSKILLQCALTKMFFILVLALLEYAVFFVSNDHFFQGDTIHWFYVRHKTLQDFLAGFASLDSGGWYRPLSNGSVQSIFFPLFGLTPFGYRVVQYVLFLAATVAVWKLGNVLTGRKMAAGVATLYFSLHTVNVYTTYDLAFVPELLYSLFYVSAVILYLRQRKAAALLCFALSLCSKEAAVTLPFVLVALDSILKGKHLFRAAADAKTHFALLAVYLLLVVGYLGVQRTAFQSVIERPGPEITYRFGLDQTALHNADTALTWAFNIPRGWPTQWRQLDGWMVDFLKTFRLLVGVLALWVMFLPERRVLLAGLTWFVITMLPAVPLIDHFFPYYLFLPLAGFSIAIGTILDAAYRQFARWSQASARFALASSLGVLFLICIASVRADARENRMLGRSSTLASNSLNDLRAAYPRLSGNTTIYISNAEEPDLNWDTSQGALFKLAYGDETIETLYWSWGEVISRGTIERGPVVVMKYHDAHLSDVTKDFLADSESPVAYRSVVRNQLAINPSAVSAGQAYRLRIEGITDTEVKIHYTLNGSPVRVFAAHLDHNGEAKFDVSQGSERGLYHFVGFQVVGTPDWIQAAGTIIVN
jgi:hypothetical protein